MICANLNIFKMSLVFIVGLGLLFQTQQVYAQESNRQKESDTNTKIQQQKDKIKRIEEEIAFLDKQISSTQKMHKSTLEELVFLKRKINNRKNLLAELDKAIRNQDREINVKAINIKRLEQRLDTLDYYYKHLIISAYKNRDSRTWFMYILASNSIEQGYRRWMYLKNYAQTINTQAQKIISTKAEIERQKEELSNLQAKNLFVQKSKETELQDLSKEEKESKKYASSLSKKQNEYKKQLKKKSDEARRLNSEIERMIALAIKDSKNQETNSPAVAEIDIKLSGEFGSNKGKLPWPVSQGVIIEQFGEHDHPSLPNVRMPFNNGINISTHKNSAVKVVFNGTVKQIILIPGYNQCVLVQHGTYFTFYCKLSKLEVKVGDKLKTGDTIGYLDDFQNTSTLHFELWNGTNKQDPENWLRKK